MTVPNWKTERYLLGELPECEMAALKILDKENAWFHAQVEQLKQSNDELLAKYPMPANACKFAVIEPIKNKWLVPACACAVLLLCATVLLNIVSEENSAQNVVVMSEDGTRVKGLKAELEIWRKTADSAEHLSNNSVARAGDLLQIRYVVPEQCYGALLSLDGNGVLTIHLSGERGKATQLEAGKAVSLENSYELDNAEKFETFYLLTANNEFEIAPIAENILSGKMPKKLLAAQITLKKK
ncbi:MAG: hypothetical protein LBH25_05315 [Fibromonadaceae bacterium]|jgi:hypothetical protein|nr:hypothetical protein [Fibromonadaceae bacterium]